MTRHLPSQVRRQGRIACSGRARAVLDYITANEHRRLTTYPFPLYGLDSAMCFLRLPEEGLSRPEAERLKLLIDALVTWEG